MSEASKERVYEPDEIEERLKRDLPHWQLRKRLDQTDFSHL